MNTAYQSLCARLMMAGVPEEEANARVADGSAVTEVGQAAQEDIV